MNDDTTAEQTTEIVDIIRQLASHYGLWLAEAVHQLGLESALDAEAEAGDRFFAILTDKLERSMGKEPGALLSSMDTGTRDAVAQSLRTAWLAADGVWFQAVESRAGMDAAKRTNDTCWSRFAPLEARLAKRRLNLPEQGGIATLKAALGARMYGHLNEWAFVEETVTSVVFRMTKCRVQSARQRKGLADYPCKSGGVTEYTSFAREIDPRLRCECVACPPDDHPDAWACAWRFTLVE